MSSPESRQKKVETTEKMPPAWLLLRKEILEQIPSKLEGLHTENVRAFFESFPGIVLNECVIFDEEDLPKLRELLVPSGLLDEDSLGEKKADGCFVAEIRLSLVKRLREYEAANGTIFTEGLLVHELAHSSSEYAQYIKPSPTLYATPRTGFSILTEGFSTARGSFLEEGFADMLRGQYVEEYATDEWKTATQIPELGSHCSPNTCVNVTTKIGYQHLLPLKYLFRNPKTQRIGYTTSSPAAFGMELLARKNDELYPAILSARHDVESLRDVARIINDIKPGSYSFLQKLKYSNEDFERGLRYIIDEIYNGTVRLNEKSEFAD